MNDNTIEQDSLRMMRRNGNRIKRWHQGLLGILLSLASLCIVIHFVDLQALVTAFHLANIRLVLVGGFAMVAWLFVRGIAWRVLLQERAKLSDVFLSMNAGYLFNNLLPFRLGELGRAFMLRQKSQLTFGEVLSSIVVERVIDVACSVCLLAVTLPFVLEPDARLRHVAFALGSGVVVVSVVFYVLGQNAQELMSRFSHFNVRWARLRSFMESILIPFLSGLRVLTDTKRFLRVIFWFSLGLGIAVLQNYLILLAFFPEAVPLWAMFSLGVAAMGMALPSTPGALGVFEGSIVGALAMFGLDPSISLAYALVLHSWSYLITGVFGACALLRNGKSLIGFYAWAQSTDTQKFS